MAETIKSTYTKQLWAFIAGNLVLFAFVASLRQWPNTYALIMSFISARLILAGGSILITLTLNNLLSADAKARLVFWKWRNPLPGSEAFTRYINQDSRINVEAFRAKYPSLPTIATEQNAAWYKIYKKHRDSPGVIDAHKNYLLFRDLTTLAVFTGLTLGIAALVLSLKSSAVSYAVLLIAQYFVLAHSARLAGRRMVCTVLAEEAAD